MKDSLRDCCGECDIYQLNAAIVCMQSTLPLTYILKFKKDSSSNSSTNLDKLVFLATKVEVPEMPETENAYGGKFISLCFIH